jgi:CubicO group peptidase (beta-lactamase class C family)
VFFFSDYALSSQIKLQSKFPVSMSYKFNATCLKFSPVVLFMLLLQPLHCQNLSELDDVVTQKQKLAKTDLVLMVANKDTIIYSKDSKIFSALRGQAPIGASSEWLTAALVMSMADEGKISLDDKVSRYIPIFTSYAKSYITIRHCLSHFTGIQSEAPKLKKMFEKKKTESLEEEVNEFAKKHIQANPGEEFRYSNIGLSIAGRILEIVSKKKFDMLAQQKLFRPLGMRQTTFSSITGGLVDPSSGARSTASDLIRFMTMLLNNGVYKGQRILSEASVKELRTIQTTSALIKYAPDEANGFQYALGAWAPENNEKEATSLTAPSLGGTTAAIDFCRGYAFVYFLKELNNDQKVHAYNDIKVVLDEKFSCK